MARKYHSHQVTETDGTYSHEIAVVHKSQFGKNEHDKELQEYKEEMGLYYKAQRFVKSFFGTLTKRYSKLTFTGIGMGVLLLALFMLPGASITTSGDIYCMYDCVSYINYTNINYDIKLEDITEIGIDLEFDPNIKSYELFLKVDGEWVSNLTDQALTKKKGEVWEFKLIGHKEPNSTVKWGIKIGNAYEDPLWEALAVDKVSVEKLMDTYVDEDGKTIEEYFTKNYYNLTYKGLTIQTPTDTICYWNASEPLRTCFHEFTLINNYGEFELTHEMLKEMLVLQFPQKTNLNEVILHTPLGDVKATDLKKYLNNQRIILKQGMVYDFTIEFKYPANAFDEWNFTFFAPDDVKMLIDPTVSACSAITDAGLYTLEESISNSGTSYCMNISANDVIFDLMGNTLDGNDVADYGIYVRKASPATDANITILNGTISDWDAYMLYFYYADNVLVDDVSVLGDVDTGILVFASDNFILNNSVIDVGSGSTDYGVYFSSADDWIVQNSKINDTLQGIRANTIDGTSYIIDSNITDNYLYDLYPYDSSPTGWIHLDNVLGTDDLPIVIINTTSTLNGWNNNASEIILVNADDSVISNLQMSRTSLLRNNALILVESDNVNITDSAFYNTEEGILLSSGSDGGWIIRNTFNNTDGYGLESSGSFDGGVIANNIFYDTDDDSIYLYSSDDIMIYNNTIWGGSAECIYFGTGCDNNVFYNNYCNTSDNTPAYSPDADNFFNTTSQVGTRVVDYKGTQITGVNIGGNVWSNKTATDWYSICVDSNLDGFCDSAYTAGGNSVDYLSYSNDYTAGGNLYWSSNQTNSTVAGEFIEFSVLFNETLQDPSVLNMSYYIFGWSNGGNWTNISNSGDVEEGTISVSGSASIGAGFSYLDQLEDDTNWTVSGDCSSYWLFGTATGSPGTGPQSGDSDDANDNFVYMESSNTYCDGSPSSGYIMYNTEIDWDAGTDDFVLVETNFYGSDEDLGQLWLQENSTGDWVNVELVAADDDGNAGLVWTSHEIDMSELSGSGYVRFYLNETDTYHGDAAFDKFNVTGLGSAGDDVDANYSTSYLEKHTGGYGQFDNITITVAVSYYNSSGSIQSGNTNATLTLEVYNGTDWLDEGDFSVTAAGNYSITVTTASTLNAWESDESVRDFKVWARYIDYNDTAYFDTINWTGVWVEVFSEQEFLNDSAVAFTDEMCETPKVLCWSNVTKEVTSSSGSTVKWYVWANTTKTSNTTATFQFDTTGGAADSCTYGGSGNWAVDCTDNCAITTNYGLSGNNITFTGSGTIDIQADITNYTYAYIGSSCKVICSTGCLKW